MFDIIGFPEQGGYNIIHGGDDDDCVHRAMCSKWSPTNVSSWRWTEYVAACRRRRRKASFIFRKLGRGSETVARINLGAGLHLKCHVRTMTMMVSPFPPYDKPPRFFHAFSSQSSSYGGYYTYKRYCGRGVVDIYSYLYIHHRYHFYAHKSIHFKFHRNISRNHTAIVDIFDGGLAV